MATTLERRPRGAAGLLRGLWHRQLRHYPDTAPRYGFLAIVVLTTVVLYYELYVGAAVAPSILREYDISFKYYVYILVIGNAIGAFGSLFAGLADRWGRANIVAYGLLLTGLLTFLAVPSAHSGFSYGAWYAVISAIEGMVLVATPALVRDFSPQIGRAAAMGFWTLGPVLGSLLVTEISSHTLSHLPAWQDQFRIAGVVGLAAWVIAFVGLRELSPRLRDQLMVSMHDRRLVEARALRGTAAPRHGWRHVLVPQIVGSALGVSLFLMIYYTAVAFLVVYFTTVFGFTQDDANGILNWWWGIEAVALVAVGIASDRLGVRKPFMVVGALGTAAMTVVLISVTSHTDTSRTALTLIVSVLALFVSVAYAPWMAAFTETVERRSPALTAHGLAVWGWTLRAVVSLSFLLLPVTITSATPLVTYGPQVQADVAAIPPDVLAAVQAHPDLFLRLSQYTSATVPAPLLKEAVSDLGGGFGALHILLTVPDHQAQLNYLQAHAPAVLAAQRDAPAEWQHWFWVCVGGEVVFLPLTLLLVGRWTPRRARQDEQAHELALEGELAALGLAGG